MSTHGVNSSITSQCSRCISFWWQSECKDRTAGLGGRGFKKHVKSMSFSFPWLGVSMLADSLFEWSKCTGKLPAYWSRLWWKKLLISCDVQPNDIFFFLLTEQTCSCVFPPTHSGVCCLFTRSKGKFHPQAAKVFTYPVILNRPPAKFWIFFFCISYC